MNGLKMSDIDSPQVSKPMSDLDILKKKFDDFSEGLDNTLDRLKNLSDSLKVNSSGRKEEEKASIDDLPVENKIQSLSKDITVLDECVTKINKEITFLELILK